MPTSCSGTEKRGNASRASYWGQPLDGNCNGAMKYICFLIATAICLSAQTQQSDTRLMNSSDYKKLLEQVRLQAPKWEASLKSIDPAKANVSYAVGKQIVDWRDLGLKEVAWSEKYAEKEMTRHTVSGELGLRGFLQAVSGLDKFAPELSSMNIGLGNDLIARVELLEKGVCP